MLWLTVQFILGMAVLNKAAGWFARGAALIAELTGMSRLWIGAILAGFVTSIEEMFVSSLAAYTGHSDIAVGNAVGSVTCNCVLIGVCLIRARTSFDKAWFRDHGLPMLLSCLLLCAAALADQITRPIGLLLILFCACYIGWSVVVAKKYPQVAPLGGALLVEIPGTGMTRRGRWCVVGLLLGLGIPLIFVSSWWLLHVTAQMAQQLGIGEGVIALSVLAMGTSLPEFATTMAAYRRGHYDTSLGVIFGSAIFIGAGTMGISSLFGPLHITMGNRLFDLPVMMLVTVIPFLPLLIGRLPGRGTGWALLIIYGGYLYSLFSVYGIFKP